MPHSEELELEKEPTAVPPSIPAPASAAREVGGREVGVREVGGREGPEPTRFSDWELRGRCVDF